ncbi:MAG: hypothetical protein QM820_65055 [Minicystis sp.]
MAEISLITGSPATPPLLLDALAVLDVLVVAPIDPPEPVDPPVPAPPPVPDVALPVPPSEQPAAVPIATAAITAIHPRMRRTSIRKPPCR